MKKKGFTLVELLAVIAILAILVVIAMPNVLGMFNSSKKNTFVTEVQSILKQTSIDFVQSSMSQGAGATLTYAGDDTAGTKLDMDTNKNYIINLDASGNVISAKIWDSSYCYIDSDTNGIKYSNIKAEDTTIKAKAADDECKY